MNNPPRRSRPKKPAQTIDLEARVVPAVGYPGPVSDDAAVSAADLSDPESIARASDDQLRAAGLSRQKLCYARSLADEVTSGRLDLGHLPPGDEDAIAALVAIKGIGRWSAEVYLLFAEGRPDIWPAGDLAVQIEIGRILGHDVRPSEKSTREVAEAWRPHRGAAAVFTWHHYGSDMKVI